MTNERKRIQEVAKLRNLVFNLRYKSSPTTTNHKRVAAVS